MTITTTQAIMQRRELAREVQARVNQRTVQRHSNCRTLPLRTVDDVAERIIAREEKLQRRATAARKAGLL